MVDVIQSGGGNAGRVSALQQFQIYYQMEQYDRMKAVNVNLSAEEIEHLIHAMRRSFH
jgi:hypothetical protein